MRNSWIVLSFVGLFCLSTMTLMITQLVRKGFTTGFVLLGLLFFVVFMYLAQVTITHGFPKNITVNDWLLIGVAAALSFVGNLAIYQATATSPNPGLVITIFGLQAGIVSIGAVWLFKDKLNSLQVLGIGLGIIAIIIIGLGSRSEKNNPIRESHSTKSQTSKQSQ